MTPQTHYPLFDHADIHTHVDAPGSVLSVEFDNREPQVPPGRPYTLGVHPWLAHKDTDWSLFEQCLGRPGVVGVGEAGLDTLHGPDMERQLQVFERQARMAQSHNLPLVIHSVRSNHHILRLFKAMRPTVPWVLHGFRGSAAEARRLLDAGLHLSLGPKARPEVRAISHHAIHTETDTQPTQ